MTWTRIDDRHFDQPAVAGLSRSARLLNLEATVYCNGALTDGYVVAGILRRITDAEDPAADVAELVAAGLWESTKGGWQIVDWDEQQETREQVEARRAVFRERQDRSRKHRSGDHSTCRPSYCKHAPVTGDATGDATGDSRESHASRSPSRPAPVPDPKGGNGARKGKAAPEAAAGLPRGRPAVASTPQKGVHRLTFAPPDDPWRTGAP